MNKGNIAIVVIAAAALLAIGNAQVSRPSPPAGQLGRYQLLYGEHEIIAANGSTVVVRGIFRIDTTTGLTSYYYNALADPPKGQPYLSEWTPISEFGATPIPKQLSRIP